MTYATLITNLRNQVGDTRRRVHVDWTGNGSDTVFQMPQDTFPVLDQSGTYVVKVNSVVKVETTDFTLDKESGTLVLLSAPTNGHAITMDSSAVHITDDGWLNIIVAVIRSLGDDYFKEFIDTSNFTTTANMLSLSLVARQPNNKAVYEFSWRKSTSEDWRRLEEFTNWRYDRDNNIIYVGNRTAFPNSSELIRIRGLKTFTIPTATSETSDVTDKFLTLLEYGSIARYWRWRYKNVVELVSKMTSENTRTPLQELIMLSDRFDRLFELEKAKLKPGKPARIIPPLKDGGGTP